MDTNTPLRPAPDRPLPTEAAGTVFVVMGYLLDGSGEVWCEIRAVPLEQGRSTSQTLTPALAILPAYAAPWDTFALTEAERCLVKGTPVEKNLAHYLQRSESELREQFSDAAGLADILLREWRGDRRLDARIAEEPFLPEAMSNWREFSAWVAAEGHPFFSASQEVRQQNQRAIAKFLRRLIREVPWAFLLPDVADLAANWARVSRLDLTPISQAVTALGQLRWERASGTRKGPKAPHQPPVLTLDASLLFTLRRLQRQELGLITDAPRLFRALLQDTSPGRARGHPWREYYKRVSEQVRRVERRIDRWRLMPMAIPFPNEPLDVLSDPEDQHELVAARRAGLERWAHRDSTKLTLLILAGGDPTRLRAFPSGLLPVTKRRSG